MHPVTDQAEAAASHTELRSYPGHPVSCKIVIPNLLVPGTGAPVRL